MNKKTVSILLILFVSIAIALFSFTSCKNEPKLEPTAAPEPGYVPEVPNNVTPLSKIGEDDLEAINTLGKGLGRFFADYSGTGTKAGKYKTSLESILEAKLTLSKPISISAPDGEGSFGGNDFTYKGFTGNVDFTTDPSKPSSTHKSLFLIVEGKVTSEVFGDGEHTVKMSYDLLEYEPYYFYLDGSTTASFYINADYDNPANYKYYNSAKEELADSDKAAVKKQIDLLMFIGYKAFAKATVEIEDLLAEKKIDENNILNVGITGQIQLSGDPLEKIDEDNIDFFDDPVVDLFKSFTATASDLNVLANLSTKAGNATDGYTTETLSASLSLSNLSLGTIYGNLKNESNDDDKDLTTVSFEKLALSAWNSDDSVILSLELSDFKLSSLFDSNPIMNISTTLGLGIKAYDSSMGVVADFELTSGKTIGLPFVNFYPRAAVINGSYYEPEGITDSLYDYLDMVISTISKYMIRVN